MSAPFQRVIPAGHHIAKLTLTGDTPLLMSSGEVDQSSDTYIAYRQLSRQRKKSMEEEDRLRELEWYTRLYYEDDLGPYIPGKNVKELLRKAATKDREGENVKRSLVVVQYRIPLLYDGPRKAADLWEAGFRYMAMVANAGAGSGRVTRTRPCFEEWSLECELAYDPADLDYNLLAAVVKRSEKYGLGDYRPEFGAFQSSLEFVREQRKPLNANANKPRNKREEKATKKMVERITA